MYIFKVYILKYVYMCQNIHIYAYGMIYNTTFTVLALVISGKQNYR